MYYQVLKMSKKTFQSRCFLALVMTAFSIAVSSAATQRPFLMATTYARDIFQYGFENPEDKDMFSIHVDDFFGIPWTNFENNTPPPAPWAAQMQVFQSSVAATGKLVYVALGPLTNRITLAGNVDSSGINHNNWAPVDANGCYPFSTDPNAQLYKQAYINYAKYMVNLFHPKFLSLAIEMNMEFARCPSQKTAYMQWYSDVHNAIKAAYPGLIVFPTFQADEMYGMAEPVAWCGGTKTDASFAACFQQHLNEALTVPADRIAFSWYPLSWLLPPTAPDNYTPAVPMESMFSMVQQTTPRKIWISETGWQGVQILTSYYHVAPDTPSACGGIGISTPTYAGDAMLANYMSSLLAQAQKRSFEAVVWWENRDLLDGTIAASCPCSVPASLTCQGTEIVYQLGGTSLEVLYHFFGNMGLRYNDGTPREPAHSLWISTLAQPYTTIPGTSGNTLDAIQVYPNPMRPSQGHTGINFSQLPTGARLRIYTLAGEKVGDLSVDSIGHATWDGNNQSGQKVASGVYTVYVQGAGQTKTLKVAIQR
jgi:hypothetical protein